MFKDIFVNVLSCVMMARSGKLPFTLEVFSLKLVTLSRFAYNLFLDGVGEKVECVIYSVLKYFMLFQFNVRKQLWSYLEVWITISLHWSLLTN